MHAAAKIDGGDKPQVYAQLLAQARGLLAGESDRIANAANLGALVFDALPGLNWVGFYFFDGRELVVGPFQGKPACVRIALGKGVCGTAAATRSTQVVRDVHEFPGHIACDAASNSEIVVPVVAADGTLVGVWDVDSPLLARFDEDDRRGMEALVRLYVETLDRPGSAATPRLAVDSGS
jgi:GAF domain-containing protein